MHNLLHLVEVSQSAGYLHEDVQDALLREALPFLLEGVKVFVQWGALDQLHDDVEIFI